MPRAGELLRDLDLPVDAPATSGEWGPERRVALGGLTRTALSPSRASLRAECAAFPLFFPQALGIPAARGLVHVLAADTSPARSRRPRTARTRR